MQIVIVGCGNVGKTITEHLCNEGHNIVVVDKKADVVNSVCETYDVMGVIGNGSSYSKLKEAGIENADLLIAVSDSDELNLLCCVIAKKAGNCQTIARVSNPAYSDEVEFIKQAMGISLIVNPKLATAHEVSRLIKYPSALHAYAFAKERVEILKLPVREGSILCDCTMKDFAARTETESLVCIVERGNDVIIPDGEFVLQEKDLISVVVPSHQLDSFLRNINYSQSRIRDVMVVGGGKTTVYLGKMLDDMGINMTIIERDRKRCEELCELLPSACVVCGDGTDRDILSEEGIEKMGAFVAWTDFDEENIMLSMYAKTVSQAKVISQVHRINYDDLIKSLDVGSVIYPKNITAEFIVRYVRAMSNSWGSNVETLYHLIEGKAEALEFVVGEDMAGLVDIPLSRLKLRDNILVCGIQHGGRTFTPKGNDVIKMGDSVIIITTTSGLTKLSDILR